jgi:hypothetical protein
VLPTWAAAALAAGLPAAGPAAATAAAGAGRYVVVNGKRLSGPEIRVLDRIHCGPVADGLYRLAANGIWGVVGDVRPRGHIESNCYETPEERRAWQSVPEPDSTGAPRGR